MREKTELYQQYNYQEIVSIGEEAARTLQSPVFMMAYQGVLNDITDRMFKAEPGHVKTLEECRREGNALAKIGNQLQMAVKRAEQVIASQQNQQSSASENAGFSTQS